MRLMFMMMIDPLRGKIEKPGFRGKVAKGAKNKADNLFP